MFKTIPVAVALATSVALFLANVPVLGLGPTWP